jgi:hypothetical protein
MKAFAGLVTTALMLAVAPTLFAANLWYDNFNDGILNAAYLTPSGGNGAGDPEWVEEGGVIKQIQPKPGDPTYCAVDLGQDIGFCGQLVKIRFDEWEDHDRSRAGVGFWLDPGDNYNGYTTLIHNSLTVGNYQFLNDARGWHPTQVDFDTGGTGSWFWMRSEIDASTNMMVGKVWVGDLADEPADWMNETDYTTYGGLREPTTWVGLNGGAGTGDGFSKVSFDEWYVYDEEGPDTAAVNSQAKLATTWGKLKR